MGPAIGEKIDLWRRILSSVARHPMTRDRRAATLARALWWKVLRRVRPGPRAIDFVGETRLEVDPGAPGSGVFYCYGIFEYEFMSFALHLLLPSDTFIDVGANLGSYTVLASGVVGCRTIAFEPVPDTHRRLLRNVALNGIGDRVNAQPYAVGRRGGEVQVTTDEDSANRVVDRSASSAATTAVRLVSLDDALAGAAPSLIKIDVEGFEAEVVAGADAVLGSPSLLALIVELNGSGEAAAERELVAHLVLRGFDSFDYSPDRRTLTALDGKRSKLGSTIFVRRSALDEVRRRVAEAPAFRALHRRV